jgi:hypothetical protein
VKEIRLLQFQNPKIITPPLNRRRFNPITMAFNTLHQEHHFILAILFIIVSLTLNATTVIHRPSNRYQGLCQGLGLAPSVVFPRRSTLQSLQHPNQAIYSYVDDTEINIYDDEVRNYRR